MIFGSKVENFPKKISRRFAPENCFIRRCVVVVGGGLPPPPPRRGGPTTPPPLLPFQFFPAPHYYGVVSYRSYP